jgi:hypothetical protein
MPQAGESRGPRPRDNQLPDGGVQNSSPWSPQAQAAYQTMLTRLGVDPRGARGNPVRLADVMAISPSDLPSILPASIRTPASMQPCAGFWIRGVCPNRNCRYHHDTSTQVPASDPSLARVLTALRTYVRT